MWYLDKRTAMTTYATLARYPWCHHFFPKPSPIQMCIQRTFFKISSRLLLTIKRWFLSAKCIRRGCVDHRQKCCERNLCNLIDSQVKLVSLASSIWCGLRFLSLCSHVLLVPRGWRKGSSPSLNQSDLESRAARISVLVLANIIDFKDNELSFPVGFDAGSLLKCGLVGP